MLSSVVCLSLLACLMMISPAHASSSLIVDTPAGQIQGTEVTASNKQTYIAFRGIPYAKPPVGELRFAKPQPHPKFENPFDAKGEIAECPQPQLPFFSGFDPGQEDCLVLNVYTETLKPGQGRMRKVIVFIHGGGFILASSKGADFGTFVTEHDIIVVTLNYRLGILGFLSTENEASPGNYGLWDQALALKWVKDNIASFGGDPDDITVSGESAGGASVAIQSITPVTKGLFTKAFPMSGTATSSFANTNNPQAATLGLAKAVSCWEGDTDTPVGLDESKEIIKCLRDVPVSNLSTYPIFTLDKVLFLPTVDGEFFTKTPAELLKDNQYLESIGFFERSYLFGLDNNEQTVASGARDMADAIVMSMQEKTEEEKAAMRADIIFQMKKNGIKARLGLDDPPDALVSKILAWYEKRAANTSMEEMFTDMAFLIPTFDFVDTLARGKSNKVYLFYFNHYPSFMKGPYRGMPHGGDLLYWMDIHPDELEKLIHTGMQGDLDQDELEMKVIFSTLIADFAKTGNPGRSLNKLPSGWPPYDLERSQYLDLSPDPWVKNYLEREKRKLWLETIPGWLSQADHSSVHTEL